MIIDQFRAYLEANGYDTSQMGLGDESEQTSVDERVVDEDEKRISDEKVQTV